MSGFGFSKILRDMLGGDISKMSSEELASAIGKIEEMPVPVLNLGELKSKRIREWGYSPFDVGLVRFVAVPGIEPCAFCASVIGKYAKPGDADFFFEHVQSVSHSAPFCLSAEPVTMPYGGPGAPLPPHVDDEEGNILDGMALNRVDTKIYEANHKEEDEDEGTVIEVFVLNKDAAAAGEYSGLDGDQLFLCMQMTLREDESSAVWVLPLLSECVERPMSVYLLARAQRARGEIMLGYGDKAGALGAFRAALSADPNVGVKRAIAKLEKELKIPGKK